MINRIIEKFQIFILTKRLCARLKLVGKNFIFDPYSNIITPSEIEIGDNVFIGQKAYIAAKVRIGNNVMFGPLPVIIGGNHYFGVKGKSNRFLKTPNRENMKQIIIEDEVWCGASVIIFGGVTINIGAIVGAGSVVNKSLPPYTVCAGNPCKPLRTIFSDADLKEHLISLGYQPEFAEKTIVDRKNILQHFNLNVLDLPVVNQTDEYFQLYKNAGIPLP